MQAVKQAQSVELTAAQVAELMGCGLRYVQKLISSGTLPAVTRRNCKNRPTYYIPLEALDARLQRRFIKGQPIDAQPKAVPFPKVERTLESFSLAEQEEIRFWSLLLEDWQTYRFERQAQPKAEADEDFVRYARVQYQQAYQRIFGRELTLSVKSIYRYWKAYRENDLARLVDKRGQALKGRRAMPQLVWDAFQYYYLDEAQHPIKKCVEYTQGWILDRHPELYEDIPSEHAFYRRVKRDIPEPVKVLGREGDKAFNDRCAPYISRIYDDMQSNEYWIADTHTLDILSNDEEGRVHRLYLVAFFDARSGIFTGCYITDTPSSQATLYALRRGIQKYGAPQYIYVDNGREFLTRDVGGLGHREKRKKKAQEEFVPPPVFERLGIKMVNALPRNAKAKTIERRFRDVKDHLSRLFATYTGGNVVERPEQLKYNLKAGKIVADAELTEYIYNALEYYMNYQPYQGAVVRDRGKLRIQVYNENLHTKRPFQEEDLNLLMLRSGRVQKVGQRGVHITVSGQRLDYFSEELWLHRLGQKVFCRYDPDDLSTVRVYDTEDRLLCVAPLEETMRVKYGDDIEKVRAANREERRLKGAAKTLLEQTGLPEEEGIAALDIVARTVARNMQEAAKYKDNAVAVEFNRIVENPLLQAVGLEDISKRLENAKKRTREANHE